VPRFRSAVGLAPKHYERLVRFTRPCGGCGPTAWRLSPRSRDLGFADQAHLSRELRSLSGQSVTPPRIAERSAESGPCRLIVDVAKNVDDIPGGVLDEEPLNSPWLARPGIDDWMPRVHRALQHAVEVSDLHRDRRD